MISAIKKMPPIQVHLYKNIPMGAGLGGGSADAAFFINMVDSKFMLDLSEAQKTEIASKLGSDCAFFLKNTPVIAVGKGNEFSEVKIDLSKYYILLVYPNIHSDTKAAYQGLSPKKAELQLKHIIENMPISQWKQFLVNDFESTIFVKYPEIKQLKEDLYTKGALYASLSGSGSAVFGIYDKMPELNFPEEFKYFLQNPDANVL
jgi:4-diphosphocytidyl-2-C-methyl-D-erythritol kinase